MLTLSNLPAGYIEEDLSTYDGRWCTSECRKSGCSHEEMWEEYTTINYEPADFSGASDELGYANDR